MTVKMIWTTCSVEEAPQLARRLLKKKVIGCANIFEPHHALYWWDGKICEDREVTMIMETNENMVNIAVDELQKQHSYDTPKIMVYSPLNVPESFSKWLDKEINVQTNNSNDNSKDA